MHREEKRHTTEAHPTFDCGLLLGCVLFGYTICYLKSSAATEHTVSTAPKV